MSTELSRKMRATFDAVLPSDDVVLRRIVARRAERSEQLQTVRTSLWHAFWRHRAGLGACFAGVAMALALLTWWSIGERDHVSIGPSLTRDLELAPRSKKERLPPLEPTKADDELHAEPVTTSRPARADVTRQAQTQLRTDVVAPSPPAQAETNARWARVTESMRKRDWEAAKIALEPLTNSPDAETRDGARLVRVRLELGRAQGASPDQRWLADLADLATSGSTSSIRASARRLLEALRTDPAKSIEPSPEPTPEEN